MLINSIYPRANLVTKGYDGCAMRVVFSKLQNCPGFNDGNFRDGGSAFQHMRPETAKAREPNDTVLVRGPLTFDIIMLSFFIRTGKLPTTLNNWYLT